MSSLEEEARKLDKALDSMKGGNGQWTDKPSAEFSGVGWFDENRVPQQLPELSDFLAVEFPEEEQLLGPIRSENLVHIASKTGVGKTNLGIAMMWQWVHGCPLWHWACPKRRSVLHVDGEMPGRQLQNRLNMYRWAEDREEMRVINAISWAREHKLPRPNLADPRWQEQFFRWGENLDIWNFDNVMSLVHVPGESLSSDKFWKPIYDFNLEVRSAGKTIVWHDHLNSMGEIFGTKTKAWAGDLVFHLEDGEEGCVKHSKHPLDAQADGCVFQVVFHKTRGLFGDEVAPFELKLLQGRDGYANWMHAFVEDKIAVSVCKLTETGLSQREVAKEVGISASKVNRILRDAKRQ